MVETNNQSKQTMAVAERRSLLQERNQEAFLRDEIAEVKRRIHNVQGLLQEGKFTIPARRNGTHLVNVGYDWTVHLTDAEAAFVFKVPVDVILNNLYEICKEVSPVGSTEQVYLETLKLELGARTDLSIKANQLRSEIHSFVLDKVEPVLNAVSDSDLDADDFLGVMTDIQQLVNHHFQETKLETQWPNKA